jgi:hypothetical protein
MHVVVNGVVVVGLLQNQKTWLTLILQTKTEQKGMYTICQFPHIVGEMLG